jgi:hypothetical protein
MRSKYMNIKTKILIRTAVRDYFEMFPEDWILCKQDIEYQKQNLMNDFATLEGTQAIKRALFAVPEKLSTMIGKKLTDKEAQEFKDLENARWFASEFPQFRLTSEI